MKNKDTKDLVMKDFEAYPDVAADLLNVFLHEGQQRVKQENLLAAPTETLYQGQEKLRNQLEDVGKYEMHSGRVRAMYLFANQSRVDSKMLFRKAGYVGGAYREQYKSRKNAFFPVIELVLYWGEERWNCRESLHELLHNRDASETLLKFTDNLKLHVFEMRNLSAETRRLFQSDMRIVVDYLAEGNGYCSDRKIVHKEALIKLLRVLSGDENVEDTLSMMQERGIKEEEDVKVCELFDQYERRGQQKEFERSIERMVLENLEEHRTEETIVGKLVRWFSLTKEQAKMYYDKCARDVV
ncbi:MAG: hypothetical protein DBY33_04245 [Lachnospiraceae bacterium]|nr:MAG: hypothetical protein DBY33_04245 [Lachnospiraceae bacterium]